MALNAEAFVCVAVDRRGDRTGVMYPRGMATRNADIEALALAPRSEVIDRLRDSCRAFDVAWSTRVPDGACCTVEGSPEFQASTVLLRRLREMEVHGADTGLEALSFTEWTESYVSADLEDQWLTVRLRTDETVCVIDELGREWSTGVTTSPRLDVTRRELLAWILDRERIAGLPALLAWGDQSRWGR